MTDPQPQPVAFTSLGLRPELQQGIREAGFVTCTPIQAQTLPLALTGRDVAGQAQTGTGKTAAFLVALYQALLTLFNLRQCRAVKMSDFRKPQRTGKGGAKRAMSELCAKRLN